jgi:uncharacterized protein (TIGR00297 family)
MLYRFFSPILLLFWFWLAFFTDFGHLTRVEIFLHFLLFLYFGVFAYLFKALSPAGVIAAAVIGTQITAVGNFSILPLVVFFVAGSLLSRWKNKHISDAKTGKPRDAIQVFTNGGPAFLISLLGCWLQTDLEILYLISLSVAAADTWSSEVGMRLSKTTVDIQTLRPVLTGISGGVSAIGLLAGFGGALSIAAFAASFALFTLVIIAGFFGTLLDSYLGSRFQALYLNAAGEPTDIPNGNPIKGYAWCSNDLVNLMSNLMVTTFCAIILL